MQTTSKIYVAGHRGVVGLATVRALKAQGHINFVIRTPAELYLTDQAAASQFFVQEKAGPRLHGGSQFASTLVT